ncbi:MAG: CHAT domain-containing protein [Cyanobium sp. M30B3]|nr:MAG: CHAT domain-containing protein [Cyanobium sp. M30B3]
MGGSNKVQQALFRKLRVMAGRGMTSSCIALSATLLSLGLPQGLLAQTSTTQSQPQEGNTATAEKIGDRFGNDPFWRSLSDQEKEVLERFGINAASSLYRYAYGLEALLIELGITISSPLPDEDSLLSRSSSPSHQNSALLASMDQTSLALITIYKQATWSALNAKSTTYEDQLLDALQDGPSLSETLKRDVMQRALALSQQLSPDIDATTYQEPDIQSLIRQAERLESEKKYEAAATAWKQLLAISEKDLGADHPSVANILTRLARLLSAQGKYGEAEPLLRRSLAIHEKSHGPDYSTLAISLNNLAFLLKNQGQYSDAEPLIRRSLVIYEKALGTDHPVVAQSLNNLALLLTDQGQYGAAEPLYRRSLAIYEKAIGTDHPNVATTLNNLALLLRNQGQYNEAEPLFRRSLAIREKALGTDHPVVAQSLNNLALLLTDQGQYGAAEPLFRRTLAIYEKAFGTDHPNFALGLNNLAMVLRNQGQYSEAEPLFRRSLAIREKALGTDHPDVAKSLNNLALLLTDQGQYGAAEPLFRRTLAIYEKAIGTDHPDVALGLNNLAMVLRNQGQYSAAEPLIRRSLVIYEKALGSDHPDVALGLNNLALLLFDQGQYRAVEPLYRRSLDIYEKAFGTDHPNFALGLNNLAMVLRNQGQYSEAEPLFRRSLAIREKALGTDHPDVAQSLNNLALLLLDQGQYGAAEPLFRRTLAIYEKAIGTDHPNVATTLNNLALLLKNQGQYSAAEPLFQRSLVIYEKALGTDHPDVAQSLNNLALLLFYQGQYGAAESLFRRTVAIYEKAIGTDHPDVALGLSNLALLLKDQRKYSAAVSTLIRSLEIEGSWLIRELPFLQDQARSAQLRKLGDTWQVSFGLIEQYLPATQLALETRLNRQGLLPEIEKRQALLLSVSSIDQAKVRELQALTQQLASVSLSADQRALLRRQRDKMQVEFYRQLPDLQIQLVTPAAVAKALPADGVLVEFQRYRPFDGRKPSDQVWGEPKYIALLLTPNGTISFVSLGPAAAIDALVHKGLSASDQDQNDAEAFWAQLSELLLRPLLPHLTGSRQWFLSPDGELNRVPFAALPAPQQPNKPLAEAVQLRLLTTGRELVRLQQPAAGSTKAVVVANPSFDRPGIKAVASRPAAALSVAQRRSGDLGKTVWSPLPGTQQEGQQVASLLGTRLVSGPQATTAALIQQQSPRVLHVATHGFFVADQQAPPSDPLRMLQEESPLLQSLRQEDPQLRSGLVLAGANQPDLDPNDDGYLTAAEALQLNLKGTQLVVLSACSTGQGDVRTGEGVYGLQRALTVAGARSTLLSLWKVDDAATAEFMVRFYRRLKAGEGRADALAAVQAEFRNGSVKGPMGEDWRTPYFWAAWQLTGDWGPIQGL